MVLLGESRLEPLHEATDIHSAQWSVSQETSCTMYCSVEVSPTLSRRASHHNCVVPLAIASRAWGNCCDYDVVPQEPVVLSRRTAAVKHVYSMIDRTGVGVNDDCIDCPLSPDLGPLI